MRVVWAALLVALALAGLVGGWFATGWRAVEAEAARLESAPREDAARRAALLAGELGARVEELRAAESQRAYYEYRNLYHDPRGASEGKSVVPSPLARGPADPLVAVHFEIAPSGAVSVPTINPDLPELSDPARAAADRVALASLEAAAGELRPLALAAAPAFPASPPAPRRKQPPPQQQVAIQNIEQSAYAQNQAPNVVYQDLQQQQVSRPRPARVAPPEPAVVEVRVSPFVWRTARLGGQDSLVALRTVGTPDGTLTQGFALARPALADWLVDRAGDMPATLAAGPSDAGAAAPLPLAGSTWHVAVDPGPAVAGAIARGAALRRGFLLQFIPTALVALLCGVLVVVLVARADRLARQRSGFAAAAAHELRTPLAGLALYGDMLAEGLGDPERHAAYARRVADEAARLGRVVGNVLGFTQLERRALSLSTAPGDAAAAARQAAERMRPTLEHAGVALALDIPDAPVPARLDEDAVQRILQNLIDNAEKYSRAAEGRVIEIAVRGTAIEVADRGPGVPRALRRRLFRPFARGVDPSGPAGLGLGLALARAQARAMGGDLTYRERAGGGSVFSLELAPA
ncbi:MAG TPA: HAMP domain-containing sensor histidine kinase [Kofleriaceae bacterium]|nr:HAMP domain-containing sensor histidine kinase [Kofleriaceae bacterium]